MEIVYLTLNLEEVRSGGKIFSVWWMNTGVSRSAKSAMGLRFYFRRISGSTARFCVTNIRDFFHLLWMKMSQWPRWF